MRGRVCDVNVRVCDPKIEDETIREISSRPRFSSMMADIYRYIFLGRLPRRGYPLPLYFFFFFLRHSVRPVLRGLARLNNGKQHEQLTISLGDGRICAYRVISSYTPVPRPFVPLLRPPLLPRSCTARSRTSPVLSRFLFLHDRRHLPLVPRSILRDRGRPLSLLYVLS